MLVFQSCQTGRSFDCRVQRNRFDMREVQHVKNRRGGEGNAYPGRNEIQHGIQRAAFAGYFWLESARTASIQDEGVHGKRAWRKDKAFR